MSKQLTRLDDQNPAMESKPAVTSGEGWGMGEIGNEDQEHTNRKVH